VSGTPLLYSWPEVHFLPLPVGPQGAIGEADMRFFPPRPPPKVAAPFRTTASFGPNQVKPLPQHSFRSCQLRVCVFLSDGVSFNSPGPLASCFFLCRTIAPSPDQGPSLKFGCFLFPSIQDQGTPGPDSRLVSPSLQGFLQRPALRGISPPCKTLILSPSSKTPFSVPLGGGFFPNSALGGFVCRSRILIFFYSG